MKKSVITTLQELNPLVVGILVFLSIAVIPLPFIVMYLLFSALRRDTGEVLTMARDRALAEDTAPEKEATFNTVKVKTKVPEELLREEAKLRQQQ